MRTFILHRAGIVHKLHLKLETELVPIDVKLRSNAKQLHLTDKEVARLKRFEWEIVNLYDEKDQLMRGYNIHTYIM